METLLIYSDYKTRKLIYRPHPTPFERYRTGNKFRPLTERRCSVAPRRTVARRLLGGLGLASFLQAKISTAEGYGKDSNTAVSAADSQKRGQNR